MMDDSKKRFQIGFIGSLGFHLFVFLVLAFAVYSLLIMLMIKSSKLQFLAEAVVAEAEAAAV